MHICVLSLLIAPCSPSGGARLVQSKWTQACEQRKWTGHPNISFTQPSNESPNLLLSEFWSQESPVFSCGLDVSCACKHVTTLHNEQKFMKHKTSNCLERSKLTKVVRSSDWMIFPQVIHTQKVQPSPSTPPPHTHTHILVCKH